MDLDSENQTEGKPSPWKTWLLPFLIGGGMGVGSLLGISTFFDDLHQLGPTGDIAGAAGALIVGLCLLIGFSLALLTVLVGKILHRKLMRNILVRLFFSILGGGVIGAFGASGEGMSTTVSWSLLFVLPILLSWSWHS